MRRNPTKFRRARKSGWNYEKLEPRQLLATLFMGTNGNDSAEVIYVDETHVDISINDTLHENVDITDGIRINLAGNDIVINGDLGMTGNDTIKIDQRITGDLAVYNVEVVTVLGDQGNHWQIGFVPDLRADGTRDYGRYVGVPGVSAGTLNGNIKVSGINRISTGDGHDIFDINLDYSYRLVIGAGAGDDLFRFNAVDRSNTPDNSFFVSFGYREISGQDGDDRFVFRGSAEIDRIFGHNGYDMVDYSRSTNSRLAFDAGGVIGNRFSAGFEKVIAATDSQNSVLASRAKSPVLSWIINGRRAKLIDPASGAAMVFENFDSFKGNAIANDQFWVLRTSEDINIENADWIQVSSDLDPLKGNLDSIEHTISILRGEEKKMFPTGSPPVQGPPASPKVVISDATGDGLVASFDANHVFSRSGSAIRFVDNLGQDLSSEDSSSIPEFNPIVTVHGSQKADYFTIEQGWDGLKLHSYGGDDAFFVGSEESGLLGIGKLGIFAGQGIDRLYANNGGPALAVGVPEYRYQNTYSISETSLSVFNVISSIFDSTEHRSMSANLRFDMDLDVVRVAGATSNLYSDQFFISPSDTTIFGVDGGSLVKNSRDSLAFDSILPYRVYESGVPGQGAVSFGDRFENIFFNNVDVL